MENEILVLEMIRIKLVQKNRDASSLFDILVPYWVIFSRIWATFYSPIIVPN